MSQLNLNNIDFYYSGVEASYNSAYPCDNGCKDDYCRCSKIENEQIENIDISKITNRIYTEIFDKLDLQSIRDNKINEVLGGISSDINYYTIDRILRINRIWDIDNCCFSIKVSSGYYGQELDGVFLQSRIASKLEEQIKYALSIDTIRGRIEYLLYLEYGSILPILENCEYEVKVIDKSDIKFGSEKHLKNVSKEDLHHYNDKNYDGIRGIVKFQGGILKLIDGYHRVYSTNGKNVKMLIAKNGRY
jgi:hypothetical protein